MLFGNNKIEMGVQKKIKKESGITIVALVVTIIVLIILAGISISLLLGENGIVTKAKQAKENTELAKTEEERQLNELYEQLDKQSIGLDTNDLSKEYIIFATSDLIGAGNNVPILNENESISYTIKESGTYNCYFITTSTASSMGACTQLYVNDQKSIYSNYGSTVAFSYYNGTVELNKGDIIKCTAGSETHKNEYKVSSVCMLWKQ